MFLKLIKNSITKNKTQKSLAFATYFLATLLICAMLNITLGIGNEISKQLRSYGANIIVLPKGSNLNIEVGNQIYEPLKNKSYLNEDKLHSIKEIFWRNNIIAFAPFLEGKVKMQKDNKIQDILIVGTYFDKLLNIADEPDFSTGIKTLYPFLDIKGEWLDDDSITKVMIGKNIANELKLNIGDTLVLNDKKVIISGIINNFEKNDNKIIMSLKLAQLLLNKQGIFDFAEVSALTVPENDLAQKARRDTSSLNALEFDKWYCTAYVSSIAYQIEEDFKGASAKVQTSVSEAERLIVNKIQALMLGTMIICLIVASIAIASLVNSDIDRRKKEIGLLKALGANSLQIYAIFVSENLIIAFFGALFGFGFGIMVSELIALNIFDHTIVISLVTLPLCVIFAIFIVVLGCAFALKDIIKLLPAQVLYGK